MIKHGMYGKPEYNAYTQMKQRCYNIKHKRYKNYGERGIIVCDRWLDSLQKIINDKNIILRPDVAVQKTFDNWVPYKDENGEEVNF